MNQTLELFAKQLASQNRVIKFAPNSVFSAIEVTQGDEEQIRQIVTTMATKIGNDITLIKTKLIPFMNDLAAEFKKKLKEYESPSEISGYKIELFELPACINELKTLGEVGKRRDREGFYPKEIYVPLPDENIGQYFVHQAASVNNVVADIVVKYDEKALTGLWEKYISNPTEVNQGLIDLTNNALLNIEDLIMLFLAGSNLKKQRPAGCSTPEDLYLDTMAQFYKEICNFIAIAEDQYETNVKIGQLVMGINNKVALLEASQYNKFLDLEMNPESILGLIVSGKRDITSYMFGDIQAHATEYLEIWHNKVKLDAFNNIERDIKKHKIVYELTINSLYETLLPQDLHEFSTPNEELLDKLKLWFDNANDSDIINPDLQARDICANVIFPNTAFGLFTYTMLEYKKMNPGLNQQDAASFAAVEMILTFLLAQVSDQDITTIVG